MKFFVNIAYTFVHSLSLPITWFVICENCSSLNLLTIFKQCSHPMLPPHTHFWGEHKWFCTSLFNQEFNDCPLSMLHTHCSIIVNTNKSIKIMLLSQWYKFQTHNINTSDLTDKQALLSVQLLRGMAIHKCYT